MGGRAGPGEDGSPRGRRRWASRRRGDGRVHVLLLCLVNFPQRFCCLCSLRSLLGKKTKTKKAVEAQSYSSPVRGRSPCVRDSFWGPAAGEDGAGSAGAPPGGTGLGTVAATGPEPTVPPPSCCPGQALPSAAEAGTVTRAPAPAHPAGRRKREEGCRAHARWPSTAGATLTVTGRAPGRGTFQPRAEAWPQV